MNQYNRVPHLTQYGKVTKHKKTSHKGAKSSALSQQGTTRLQGTDQDSKTDNTKHK